MITLFCWVVGVEDQIKPQSSVLQYYNNVSHSEGIAKDGQQWLQKPDQNVAYMKNLENICKSRAVSFTENRTPARSHKVTNAELQFLLKNPLNLFGKEVITSY